MVIRSDGSQIWQPPLKELKNDPPPVPAEIWIHLSPPAAAWDFSSWLQAARPRWTDPKIDICFLAFDPMSVTTDLFDRLDALADRKVCWRTRVIIDGRHVTSTAIIDRLLRAMPDELEVYLAGVGEPDLSPRVLGAVKDLVDLRNARGQNLPKIIGRLCLPNSADSKRASEVRQWARQVGLDQLQVTDKQTEEKRLWA